MTMAGKRNHVPKGTTCGALPDARSPSADGAVQAVAGAIERQSEKFGPFLTFVLYFLLINRLWPDGRRRMVAVAGIITLTTVIGAVARVKGWL